MAAYTRKVSVMMKGEPKAVDSGLRRRRSREKCQERGPVKKSILLNSDEMIRRQLEEAKRKTCFDVHDS